jgi:hypothetical protein
LNNRVAVWIAFLVALLSRYLLLYNCRLVDGDKSMQVAAAINIIKGKGYTLPIVNADDFNVIHFVRLNEWPPLYSYLIVPFLKITNMNIDTSCYILEVISITIFLAFFWRILKQIGFSPIVQFILLIWVGFIIRPIYIVSLVTDFLAAGFFMGALSFFLSYLQNNKNKEIIFTILLSVASVYCRYMYLPIVFVFPLLLFWYGNQLKNKTYIFTGILVSLIIMLVLIPLLLPGSILSGNMNNYWSKGFYFENLLTFSNVFWDTFLDKELLIYQISIKTQTKYSEVVKILSIINYVIVFSLIVYFVIFLFSKRKKQFPRNNYQNFFICGGMISLSIFFFLAYASFTNHVDWRRLGMTENWTYFAEPRYFIFVHYYLLTVAAYHFLEIKNVKKNVFGR